MKVAVYSRVSTKDKEQNPENQLIKLREFCQRQGYDIYREYVDTVSGSNWNRPLLKELMNDAWHKRFDKVVVVKLDRFGRSAIDLLNNIKTLQEKGVDFVCIDQQIDTTTSTGKFLLTVLSGVAELERDMIRERVVDGLERAKAEGKRLGRPKKVLDEKEVLQLYNNLESTRKVAEKLGVSHVLVYNLLLKKHPEILQRTKTQKMDVHNRNDKLTGDMK